ncbi:MAG TPA: hypothetical protein VMC83_41615 [Streptosporangiaceae bacterium]|nr:hypothetical protein [Streptosporangiaceae bacterium]
MEDTRRQPGPPDGFVNGHDLSARTPANGLTTTLHRESPDREATRYLAAATQTDLSYAEFVVEKVINERFRALAPTFGVDVPVVAKWALKALHTRASRDYALSVMLLGFLFVSLLNFRWQLMIILTPAVLVAAWLAVSWENWVRLRVVIDKMLRHRFDASKAPEPRQESHRQRLEEVEKRRDGNLVVFSGHSAFIGSGDPLGYRRVLFDITREEDSDESDKDDVPNKADEADGVTERRDFTSQDLHTALVEAFDSKSGLGTKLDNLKVYERLFVNGLNIQGSELFERADSLHCPPASVGKEFLAEAAVHPTPEARTYVCVEMAGWKGQLVVTLFIRAVYTGDLLFLEWTFRVLPPVRREFLRIDRFYDMAKHRQVRLCLRDGLQETIPALLTSPFRALRAYRKPYVAKRRELRQADIIKRGYVFDYGAKRSIRERACGWQRHHYFLARDENMYVLLAQQRLTQAVRDFLKKHGIPLVDYDSQVKVILNNTLNNNTYNVGDVKDSTGVVIGNNSKANVGDSAKGKK